MENYSILYFEHTLGIIYTNTLYILVHLEKNNNKIPLISLLIRYKVYTSIEINNIDLQNTL